MVDILFLVLAIGSIAIGVVGTIVPILPGLPMIFVGAWLIAWLGHYEEISMGIVILLGVLTIVGIAIDWVAQTLGAKKAGATKLGVVGSLIGTILGIFTGLWGLLFMPLIGAFIGEFIDHQDAIRSGKVGIATWVGMLAGTVIKLGLAFTMLGVIVGAWFI